MLHCKTCSASAVYFLISARCCVKSFKYKSKSVLDRICTFPQRPTVLFTKHAFLTCDVLGNAGQWTPAFWMTGPAVYDMKSCLIIMKGRTWQMHEERSWTTHTHMHHVIISTRTTCVCVCVRVCNRDANASVTHDWISRCVAGLGYKYTLKKLLIPVNMMRYERSVMLCCCQVRSMRRSHSDLKGSWHEKSD